MFVPEDVFKVKYKAQQQMELHEYTNSLIEYLAN